VYWIRANASNGLAALPPISRSAFYCLITLAVSLRFGAGTGVFCGDRWWRRVRRCGLKLPSKLLGVIPAAELNDKKVPPGVRPGLERQWLDFLPIEPCSYSAHGLAKLHASGEPYAHTLRIADHLRTPLSYLRPFVS
jgi:hypothetical protein